MTALDSPLETAKEYSKEYCDFSDNEDVIIPWCILKPIVHEVIRLHKEREEVVWGNARAKIWHGPKKNKYDTHTARVVQIEEIEEHET